jgi:uncharacterized protein
MNRRKFLGNSTKQLVLLNLLGLSSTSIFASKSIGDQSKSKADLQYRVLGKTGIKIPIVSMGVMNANNPNLLKGAWDSGIRHFDTAWYYQNGNNEKMVGSVLRELKVKRDDVIIATKVGFYGQTPPDGKERKALFLKRFDESLTRLNMDYADILYFHDARSANDLNDPYILEAFTELKSVKKIRFKGFSAHNYWPDTITDPSVIKFYDVMLLTFNFAMFNDQNVFKALTTAHAAGIGLIAMKTQCRQDWYKMGLPAEQQKFYVESNINSALLKWVLRHDFITTAVPGFTTFDQLKEDISAASDLKFTKEEEDFFKSKDIKTAIQSVCRHCEKCIGTCPQNADIPSLMRTHMYSFSYGNPLIAKQTLADIKPGRGLDACNDCTKCISKCQFRVPIESRIKELREIYC